MRRLCGLSVLVIGFVLIAFASGPETVGQDKKDKKDKKGAVTQVVEGTDKAGNWGYWKARVGLKMISDRDYAITALPKEMLGGTFLTRGAGDYGQWLPEGTLKAKMPATAYAIVRTKYINKNTFDDAAQKQFEKDGWVAVDGKFATTSPGKENWEWKAFKKDIDEGPVSLPLKNLDWSKHGTAVMFFFKEREKAKAENFKLGLELAFAFLPVVGGKVAIALAPILTARGKLLANTVERTGIMDIDQVGGRGGSAASPEGERSFPATGGGGQRRAAEAATLRRGSQTC